MSLLIAKVINWVTSSCHSGFCFVSTSCKCFFDHGGSTLPVFVWIYCPFWSHMATQQDLLERFINNKYRTNAMKKKNHISVSFVSSVRWTLHSQLHQSPNWTKNMFKCTSMHWSRTLECFQNNISIRKDFQTLNFGSSWMKVKRCEQLKETEMFYNSSSHIRMVILQQYFLAFSPCIWLGSKRCGLQMIINC